MRKAPISLPGREMAKQAAQDAVKSLVVRDWIPLECSAALYAPFAPIIPVEELTSRSALLRLLHPAGQRLQCVGLD